MRWIRDKFGGLVPRRDNDRSIPRDPVERQADKAAEFFEFTEGERAAYVQMQRQLAGNPALLKKLIRRQRKFLRAARMSPTIKSRPYKRSRRSK